MENKKLKNVIEKVKNKVIRNLSFKIYINNKCFKKCKTFKCVENAVLTNEFKTKAKNSKVQIRRFKGRFKKNVTYLFSKFGV